MSCGVGRYCSDLLYLQTRLLQAALLKGVCPFFLPSGVMWCSCSSLACPHTNFMLQRAPRKHSLLHCHGGCSCFHLLSFETSFVLQGALLNAYCPVWGCATALHWAAWRGHYDTCKWVFPHVSCTAWVGDCIELVILS